MPHVSEFHAPHVPRTLTRLPRRVLRRACEALVVLAVLAIVLPWIGLVIAGLFDNGFVPGHLPSIRRLFTLLTICASGSLVAGLAGLYLSRGGRPVH